MGAEFAVRAAGRAVVIPGDHAAEREGGRDPLLQLGQRIVAPIRGAGRVERAGCQIKPVMLVAFQAEDAEGPIMPEPGVEAGAHDAEVARGERHGRVERGRRFPGDEVDDAADRIRAVECGCSPFDDFHTFEPSRRLPIEIQYAAALDATRADDWLSVDEDQDLPGIDPLNLLTGGAGRL